ncbi:hypothetical protein [Anaerostipes caccae]|uniref:hypothetical protein n=1 Tax=Anaerostipes caccae TaxID=105841 RepID=UPI0038D3E96C
MKLWENTALTEKGTALQNKLFDGQTLKITGAKAGAGEVPPVNLRQQTQITDERQEITLQPVRTEDGKAVIPVLLENTEVKESYELHQVGFYAQDPEEGEILYCIAQTSEGKKIPSAAESPGFSITWNFCFQNSDTAPFEVVLDSAGLVGIEQHKKLLDSVNEIKNRINELSSELNKKADSTVVSQGLAGKANQTDLNTLSSQVNNLKNMKIVTGNGPITVGPYGNADTWVNFPSTFSSPPIVIICNAYSSYSRGLAAVDITKTGFNARGSNMGSGTTTFYYSYVAIGK